MATTKKRKMQIQRRLAENGQYYFVLVGTNYEVMMTSETYATKSSCDRARRNFLSKLKAGLAELTEVE